MKKECERTRKALPNYLHGHVFMTTRNRIARHLAECVMCRSEFEGLKRAEETRRILKDVDLSEGVVHSVKHGVSSLRKLKKIVYRPLWIAGIALAAFGVYYYAMMPRQLDLELENIVKTAPIPAATAPTATVVPSAAPLEQKTAPTVSTPEAPKPVPPPAAAAPAKEPLLVTIVPENDQSAVRKINEILRGHAQLRKKRFSSTDREVSGSLTSEELLTMFDRIRQVGTVRYNRKRFASLSGDQSVPFVLKLQAAPRTSEKPASSPQPAQVPAATPGPAQPASGPAPSTMPERR